MAFYRVCPLCGAHLDPGEICDCRESAQKEKAAFASDQEVQMPRNVNKQEPVNTSILSGGGATVKPSAQKKWRCHL